MEWNYLTDSFLKAFADEFHDELSELSMPGQALDPRRIATMVDEAMATYDEAEARAAPAGLKCSRGPGAAIDRVKNFAVTRHDRVMQSLWR